MTEPLCPKCFTVLGGWTDPSGREASPKVDDYSVCLHCQALLVFREPLPSVRLMTLDDVDTLDLEQAVRLGIAVDLVKRFQLYRAQQN